MTKSVSKTAAVLRIFALSLLGSWEDHPWGETATKLGKKVYVFFGHEQDDAKGLNFS